MKVGRKVRRVAMVGIVVAAAAIPVATTAASGNGGHSGQSTLVQAVRDATRGFRDVDAANAAGYASLGTCVSGPQEGAMGVHFMNMDLFMDSAVDAATPEMLTYEPRGGGFRLLGVEYLVLADGWNEAHPDGSPPVLLGQHFQFVSTPNRYRLPAFYELHVWAWRANPLGTFADFNPNVACDDYTGE